MKKQLSLFLSFCLIAVSVLGFSGCENTAESTDSDKLNIVATIFPYYDFASNICASSAQVKMLLSPGSEPHSYDPSPSDIVAIENCDLFIYNGGESDEWVEDVLDSLQNKNIKILCMTDYVDLLGERQPDHTEGDEPDEHIWTSVRNVGVLCGAILNALCEIDEANSDFYKENCDEYKLKLAEIDSEIKEVVRGAERNTLVFGDRFPFLYFVTDYGLDYECAFPGCSSETEPGISTVTRLIDYVREEEIPVVFYLELSNAKTAKLIAEDTGAKTVEFYSCHNVTKEQFENSVGYTDLMKQNVKSLKEALS